MADQEDDSGAEDRRIYEQAEAKIRPFLEKLLQRAEARAAFQSLQTAGCDRVELGFRLIQAEDAYRVTKESDQKSRLGVSGSRLETLPKTIRSLADEVKSVNQSVAASPVYLLIEKLKSEPAFNLEMEKEIDT